MGLNLKGDHVVSAVHAAAGAIVVVNGVLTARDLAVADSLSERVLLAGAWLAFAAVGAVRDALVPNPRFSIWAAVIAVNLGAMVGTRFRPGLVMDMGLPTRTTSDEGLMRWGRAGQIGAMAAGFAYLLWAYR